MQLDAVLPALVNIPAAHGLQTPLTPPPPEAVPWTYVVLTYCPAGQDVTAVAKPVSVVVLQALVTYWLLLGVVQGLHEPAVLVADVKVLPPEQALHTPFVPVARVVPTAYVVLMYWPAGQDVTAAAKTVFAVVVHELITYCVPFGDVQVAIGHVAIVPAASPEAL